jgi:hypothetical protein
VTSHSTQYFHGFLADYESDALDLGNRQTFRRLDKPMGCQTEEGEEEFRKRLASICMLLFLFQLLIRKKITSLILLKARVHITRNSLLCSFQIQYDSWDDPGVMYQSSIMAVIIQVLESSFSIS